MLRRRSLLTLAGIPLVPDHVWAGASLEFEERKILKPVAGANDRYRLFAPQRKSGGVRLPLLVYLHGAGGKGDENQKAMREAMPQYFASEEVQAMNPIYVLAPQCKAGELEDGRPQNWVNWRNQKESAPAEWTDSDAKLSRQLLGAAAALDSALESEAIDATRVYLCGVSMGGSGTWNWAARAAKRFAAIIPVCGLSEPEKAKAMRRLPVWTFQGELDTTVPVVRTRKMVEALQGMRAPVRYSEFAGAGHSIERLVRGEAQLLPWLFSQRRAR